MEQLKKYNFDDKTSEIFILLTDGKSDVQQTPSFNSKSRKVTIL